ncbi:MAG: 16S rRNA (adenine(1518)-N(6)/adenine(1519)-N(6))-dimethyltransferase RsmA [Methanomassiliicoccales archaeon]
MRISEILEITKKYGVTPRKRKGQNFLVDERVANREVEYAQISKDDEVLEIGPGLGILTSRLVERASKVIAIEYDKGLARFIRDRFGEKVELIEGDALQIEFPAFDKIVSNIPYNISTPLLFKILGYKFDRAVLMIQKEFAERMVAMPGDEGYSRLSVGTYYRAHCELLEFVPRSRFWPAPDVDSMIISLTPRDPPFKVKDEMLYFSLVDLLFKYRRKKIGTVMRMKGIIANNIERLPFSNQRIETLTPEEIGILSDMIFDIIYSEKENDPKSP